MKLLPKSPARIAGLLSILSAVLVLVIWYILLFVAMPHGLSLAEAVTGQLQYTFSSENPTRWFFVWLAALPFLCAAIGTAYLLNLARSTPIAILLFASTISLGVAVLVFNSWDLAFFVGLPAIWGWRCLGEAQLTIRADA